MKKNLYFFGFSLLWYVVLFVTIKVLMPFPSKEMMTFIIILAALPLVAYMFFSFSTLSFPKPLRLLIFLIACGAGLLLGWLKSEYKGDAAWLFDLFSRKYRYAFMLVLTLIGLLVLWIVDKIKGLIKKQTRKEPPKARPDEAKAPPQTATVDRCEMYLLEEYNALRSRVNMEDFKIEENFKNVGELKKIIEEMEDQYQKYTAEHISYDYKKRRKTEVSFEHLAVISKKWNLPKDYLYFLSKHTFNIEWDISGEGFFYLDICPAAGLIRSQCGYSLHGLTGEEIPDWPKDYLVIATENADPYCLDLSLENSPVFHAAHGAGSWNFYEVAPSFIEFLKKLNLKEPC